MEGAELTRRRKGAILAVGLALVLWLANTSAFVAPPRDGGLRLLAHRGVHQRYAGGVPGPQTCTAAPVGPITHPFIENTIPSMAAAFDAGAEVVEIDVHLTPDGVFAVFHDWTLDCRTDGTGQTNQMDFATLGALDAGYGYSADGRTYPLRGTGVGAIPRLDDVLARFPDGRFLINFKSDRASEGRALVDLLGGGEGRAAQVFGVYGGERPTRAALDGLPGLRGFDRASVKSCLVRYGLTGWTGRVPAACRDTIVPIPIDVAPFLWGWPDRFQRRLARAGTEIVLVGPHRNGSTAGLDDPAALGAVPDGFGGLVWTNAIEEVGAAPGR